MIFRKLLFIFLACLGFLSVSAQTPIIDSLNHVLANMKEDTDKVNTLNILSKKLYIIDKYDSSLSVANTALGLASKLGFEKGRGYALKNIGVCYDCKGNYPASLENLREGLSVFMKIGNKEGISVCYNNLGNAYRDMEDLPKSLENFLKALSTSQDMKDSINISYCLVNIGNVYQDEENYPEALEYHLKALSVLEKRGDKYAQSYCMTNIGNAYHHMYDSSKALEYYRKALRISRETGENELSVRILNDIGNVYYDAQNYPRALEYLLNALTINKEMGGVDEIGRLYNDIGNAYTKEKKYPEAKIYFNTAMFFLQKKDDKIGIKDLYLSLTRLDSINGDYEKGLEDYIKLRDSTIGTETQRDIALRQVKFENDKLQRTDSLQHAQENKINDLKLERQRVFSFGGTIALLVVLTLLVIVFRQRNRITREKVYSDANLRNIFDNTDISYILLDHELNIVSYNQCARKLFEDIAGKELKGGNPAGNYLREEERRRIMEMCKRALTGEYLQSEENYKRKDGTEVGIVGGCLR
jgi:PAS domain S-box-containing protein